MMHWLMLKQFADHHQLQVVVCLFAVHPHAITGPDIQGEAHALTVHFAAAGMASIVRTELSQPHTRLSTAGVQVLVSVRSLAIDLYLDIHCKQNRLGYNCCLNKSVTKTIYNLTGLTYTLVVSHHTSSSVSYKSCSPFSSGY
jgi:hypothetical protein